MTDPSLPYSPFEEEPLAGTQAEVRRRHESNRGAWNEGAQHYATTLDQSIAQLRAGVSNLHPIERKNLGDLRQYPSAIHLQCASGRDTLSLWLEGVQHVTGVDISEIQIANAQRMSAALDAPAQWFRCDVLDTPAELDGTADLVYTGRGAICWLHDLQAWAAVVARLLKPGGVFHILDDHPVTWLFDPEAETLVASGVNYFQYAESSRGWPTSYIGDSLGIPVEQQALKYERLWPLSMVTNSLIGAGLVIEFLGEHAERYWNNMANLAPELQTRIPNTFSIKARKPFAPSGAQ